MRPLMPHTPSGLPRLVARALWAGLLIAVAFVVGMVGLQQSPIAHLASAHERGATAEHVAHETPESAFGASEHIELESAHDFDDGNPADATDCCSQTLNLISTSSPVISSPAVIAPNVRAAGSFGDGLAPSLDVRAAAATSAIPRAIALTELSLQQV